MSGVPTGSIISFAGTVAPDGYLLCDDKSYSVAKYPDLYKVIGNRYGGDTANFNVPNMTGKYVIGGTPVKETVGQADFIVTKNNIQQAKAVQPSNYVNIPVVFNSPGGIADWGWTKGKPTGDSSEEEYFPRTVDKTSDGSNLSDAVAFGVDSPTGIDNRPPSYVMTYIIKT